MRLQGGTANGAKYSWEITGRFWEVAKSLMPPPERDSKNIRKKALRRSPPNEPPQGARGHVLCNVRWNSTESASEGVRLIKLGASLFQVVNPTCAVAIAEKSTEWEAPVAELEAAKSRAGLHLRGLGARGKRFCGLRTLLTDASIDCRLPSLSSPRIFRYQHCNNIT